VTNFVKGFRKVSVNSINLRSHIKVMNAIVAENGKVSRGCPTCYKTMLRSAFVYFYKK